jgi:hypothetical protein
MFYPRTLEKARGWEKEEMTPEDLISLISNQIHFV